MCWHNAVQSLIKHIFEKSMFDLEPPAHKPALSIPFSDWIEEVRK